MKKKFGSVDNGGDDVSITEAALALASMSFGGSTDRGVQAFDPRFGSTDDVKGGGIKMTPAEIGAFAMTPDTVNNFISSLNSAADSVTTKKKIIKKKIIEEGAFHKLLKRQDPSDKHKMTYVADFLLFNTFFPPSSVPIYAQHMSRVKNIDLQKPLLMQLDKWLLIEGVALYEDKSKGSKATVADMKVTNLIELYSFTSKAGDIAVSQVNMSIPNIVLDSKTGSPLDASSDQHRILTTCIEFLKLLAQAANFRKLSQKYKQVVAYFGLCNGYLHTDFAERVTESMVTMSALLKEADCSQTSSAAQVIANLFSSVDYSDHDIKNITTLVVDPSIDSPAKLFEATMSNPLVMTKSKNVNLFVSTREQTKFPSFGVTGSVFAANDNIIKESYPLTNGTDANFVARYGWENYDQQNGWWEQRLKVINEKKDDTDSYFKKQFASAPTDAQSAELFPHRLSPGKYGLVEQKFFDTLFCKFNPVTGAKDGTSFMEKLFKTSASQMNVMAVASSKGQMILKYDLEKMKCMLMFKGSTIMLSNANMKALSALMNCTWNVAEIKDGGGNITTPAVPFQLHANIKTGNQTLDVCKLVFCLNILKAYHIFTLLCAGVEAFWTTAVDKETRAMMINYRKAAKFMQSKDETPMMDMFDVTSAQSKDAIAAKAKTYIKDKMLKSRVTQFFAKALSKPVPYDYQEADDVGKTSAYKQWPTNPKKKAVQTVDDENTYLSFEQTILSQKRFLRRIYVKYWGRDTSVPNSQIQSACDDVLRSSNTTLKNALFNFQAQNQNWKHTYDSTIDNRAFPCDKALFDDCVKAISPIVLDYVLNAATSKLPTNISAKSVEYYMHTDIVTGISAQKSFIPPCLFGLSGELGHQLCGSSDAKKSSFKYLMKQLNSSCPTSTLNIQHFYILEKEHMGPILQAATLKDVAKWY